MAERPYVLLSCSMSIDGYVDGVTDERLLLSNDADFDRVDGVRAACDAILVGARTIRRDNPRLLVRSEARRAQRVANGLHPTPIKVTVLYPGYIVSEMSGTSARTPLMTSTEKGVRAMVEAIEKEKKSARVPAWPWAPLGVVVRHAPVGLLRRMS